MDKHVANTINRNLAYGRGYVYCLQYHFVWCTKYRHPVLTDAVREDLAAMLTRLADEYAFSIHAMEIMLDHVHMLFDCKPQFCPSTMAKILKGNTAHWLFLKHPELKARLWGGHLWNPSYCVVTVSERSFEQVRQYIASQQKEPG